MKSNLLAYGRVAALLAGTAVVGTFAATPANAAIRAGVLTCNVAGGVGAVVASQKAVSCTFKPSVRAPVEFYTGSFTRLGLDLSATNAGVLTYEVISASDALGPFSLAGNYAGPGVGLTIGQGLGLDALVGGNANQIQLQPLAVSTSTGLGINAGIGNLNLVAAGTERPMRHHNRRHHHHYHR
jgi:hypothetical protein